MKQDNKSIKWYHPAFLTATWFGIGKIPFAPGTWGSFFTFPLFILSFGLIDFASSESEYINIYLFFIAFIFVIGVWATNVYMKYTGRHDPKEVVIDEVAGQILVLFAAQLIVYDFIGAFDFYFNPSAYSIEKIEEINTLHLIFGTPAYILSFALFRLFDIWKPWPIRYCDQNIKGGFGVMFDDIFAAIYAVIVLYLIAMIAFM